MDPLFQFILIILGAVAFIVIAVGISYGSYYLRTQRRIRDIDYTIWALESGAEKVSFSPRDTWLEFLIKERDLSLDNRVKAKNVLIEKHRLYKSFFFDSQSEAGLNSRKGLLVMLESKSCPRLLIVPTERIGVMHKRFYDPLPRAETILPGGISAFYNFRPDQSHTHIYDAHEFLKTHSGLFEVFQHPGLLELFINQNYVAAYFSHESVEYPDNRELFGLDELIAKALLKDHFRANDPAAEIRILKDDASNQNRD